MKKVLIVISLFIFAYFAYQRTKKINFNSDYEVGQAIDSLNGVIVYFNGGTGNVERRNTVDGYNLGLEYQCVEFVKRYYYEHYQHKMPDTYGHAKHFFDKTVKDGELNTKRNLYQFTNPSKGQPQVGDLIIMKGTLWNKYGHVAIVSNVTDQLEIIQQNPGAFASSRATFDLIQLDDDRWKIDDNRILGWLSKSNE